MRVKTKTLLADEEVLVSQVILEPGARTAREIHVAQSETIFLLRGRVLVEHSPGETVLWVREWGRGTDKIGFETSLVIRPNVEHAVINVGDEFAEYMSVMRRVPEVN